MFLVDAHADLAWNALTFGRDYTLPAHVTRERERGTLTPTRNGDTLHGLADWLAGRVALIFGTLFVSPKRLAVGDWDTECYRDPAEAHRLYARQLDYYARLTDSREVFRWVRTRADLEAVLATWAQPDLAQRRIGFVTLMEGADGIREPKEAEWWLERGVRIIGPAWTATRYSGGTGEPGPLTAEGRRLLGHMADLGLMLDVSHMSDESCLQALDLFPGVVLASHANPRTLLKAPARPERHLSDEMIRRLAERGGVMGMVPYNRFLDSAWTPSDGKRTVTLAHVVAAIDHVCQVTGAASHVGLGCDFDGGFGVQATPAEIDTVADLPLLADLLRQRGYTEPDIAGVLGQNWVALLRRGLPT